MILLHYKIAYAINTLIHNLCCLGSRKPELGYITIFFTLITHFQSHITLLPIHTQANTHTHTHRHFGIDAYHVSR